MWYPRGNEALRSVGTVNVASGPGGFWTVLSRKRIWYADAAERIHEINVIERIGGGERCYVGKRIIDAGLGRSVIEPDSSAYSRLAIGSQPIGKTHLGSDICELRIGARLGATRVMIFSTIQHADGRIGIPLRFLSRCETDYTPLAVPIWEERIVTDAEV